MKILMKKMAFFAGILVMLGSAACAQKSDKRGSKASKAELTTEMDSVSYIFGASLGQNIRQAEIDDIEKDMVIQGLLHALESDEAMKISMEDGNNMVRNFMTKQQAVKAEKATAKAMEYMDERAKDEAYSRTESGILYKFMEQGDGAKPSSTTKVRVNYEGKNTEGEVFDSSYDRGQPAEFALNRVIPGWTETLQLMAVGSTVEAIIPPALAYGERGAPPNIGPNEVLIFKIELLDIIEE